MSSFNRRTFISQAAGLGLSLAARRVLAGSVNEQLNVGFIGTGDRASVLLKQFTAIRQVRVAALCDPDGKRLHDAARKYREAAKYADLRRLLDDSQIDAVVIATCNHWHALAAIWACQAGKDVYVEKPLSHNHWEGMQVVRTARKEDRIVQVGTQQRSDPLQTELKSFLHGEQALGPIKYVQVCRFGQRAAIGHRKTPLKPPPSVNYNLWLGPASDQPIYRDKLHYDWHWDWNTGNGEMGNWGVHVLDDALNVALRDAAPFPRRVAAAGGRVLWNDAGQTPNVSFVFYDSGVVPVLYAMSNLPKKMGGSGELEYKGVTSGYVVHCEGGYYAGGRGGGAAYDRDGKPMRRFKGDSGAKHARNFIDAIESRDRTRLNAEVQLGHQATAWCNLANIAIQASNLSETSNYKHEAAEAIDRAFVPWGALVDVIEKHLTSNQVDPATGITLSPLLKFDPQTEQFIGEAAASANRFLRRQYRPQFEVRPVA
jgi:predicted dehydrogenase